MDLKLEHVTLPDVEVVAGDAVVVELSGTVNSFGVVEASVVTARRVDGGALGYSGEELSGTRRDEGSLD